ncbi:MAG: hypothetical protein L0Y71_19270 [Gemmataceae bacterium]|nr:hypothetical protein [Gemmataceae bacterium]
MGMSRKHALKRIEGLIGRAAEHLEKLKAKPSLYDDQHWRHEMNNWLRQMEEVLPHVGTKTAQYWQDIFNSIKRASNETDVSDSGA